MEVGSREDLLLTSETLPEPQKQGSFFAADPVTCQ